ncbi:hypothetical protein [Facilibium subflavum]|uniref:hypothetical protein n=1 Tax=Facilibium subflavum TaxID=2219058 RepID=UPI000E645FF5|nr:hypothetical protein [Facilibium subflavum]
MARLFLFDIDETLLCVEGRKDRLHRQVVLTNAVTNPYGEKYGRCYVLNKEAMFTIFSAIIKNKDEIGFITSGDISKQEIQQFFRENYHITLPDNFFHQNQEFQKGQCMEKICQNKAYQRSELVLIDNSNTYIQQAKSLGYKTIYADTNSTDISGNLYLSTLLALINEKQIENSSICALNLLAEYDFCEKVTKQCPKENNVKLANTVLIQGKLPDFGQDADIDNFIKSCIHPGCENNVFFYKNDKSLEGVTRRLKKLNALSSEVKINIIDEKDIHMFEAISKSANYTLDLLKKADNISMLKTTLSNDMDGFEMLEKSAEISQGPQVKLTSGFSFCEAYIKDNKKETYNYDLV